MPLSLVSRCRAMMFSAVRFFSFHQDVARVLSVFETHFIFLNKHQKRQKTKSCNTKKREGGAVSFYSFLRG